MHLEFKIDPEWFLCFQEKLIIAKDEKYFQTVTRSSYHKFQVGLTNVIFLIFLFNTFKDIFLI